MAPWPPLPPENNPAPAPGPRVETGTRLQRQAAHVASRPAPRPRVTGSSSSSAAQRRSRARRHVRQCLSGRRAHRPRARAAGNTPLPPDPARDEWGLPSLENGAGTTFPSIPGGSSSQNAPGRAGRSLCGVVAAPPLWGRVMIPGHVISVVSSLPPAPRLLIGASGPGCKALPGPVLPLPGSLSLAAAREKGLEGALERPGARAAAAAALWGPAAACSCFPARPGSRAPGGDASWCSWAVAVCLSTQARAGGSHQSCFPQREAEALLPFAPTLTGVFNQTINL